MSGPLCNRCRAPMVPGVGVVPVWECECGRVIPMESVPVQDLTTEENE